VFDSEPKLRHLPFFEDIAGREEGTADWHESTAGLVVLRLVDTWLEHGNERRDVEWTVRSVRCAIEAVSEGTTIRTILDRVVDALEEGKPDFHVVVTPLMAYGKALEYDAKWMLAADVYQAVLAHLHPFDDGDAAVAAHLRLGQCYRSLNRLDDASDEFETAFEVATATGDMVGVLRARIGDAQIALVRGNLPRAASLLDDTIARATGPEFSDVRSRALHDRSTVATLAGQYELAIRLGYEALGHSESAAHRDRILADIAAAFLQLGVHSAARDAYLVLSATAQEQYTRWTSTLNLLEIAAQTGTEVQFEAYRRQLVAAQLPPYLATALHLTLGTGFRRFGHESKARVHLERALALAAENQNNQFIFEAEKELRELTTPLPPSRDPVVLSLDLQEVATAIKGLRDAVAVR
jgi:tetratricopeptide (TPR) repeat protein